MFVLVELSDNIRILPHLFDEEVAAVTAEINKKYANKVLHNVGLVVCLFDIRSISDGLLFPADGSSHVKAVFRVVVFRPFIGEVLIGTIRASDPDGIYGTKRSIVIYLSIYLSTYLSIHRDLS